MKRQMTKVEVIQETIGVLGNISVPVKLKEQILVPIEGAINNLAIVLQMIRMEDEANKNPPEEPEPEPGDEPANPNNLFELTPDAVGCPEDEPEPGMEPLMMPEKKEAGKDEPETDPE